MYVLKCSETEQNLLCYYLTKLNTYSDVKNKAVVYRLILTYIVSDGAAQLVHSWSCLSNFLGSANDIRRILQRPFSPEEKTWKDQWLFLIYCKLIQYAGASVCFRGLFFGQKQECIVNHGNTSGKRHQIQSARWCTHVHTHKTHSGIMLFRQGWECVIVL